MPNRRSRCFARAADRESQVFPEQSDEPAQHMVVSQTQMLGVVGALADAVTPSQRPHLLRAAPSAVIDQRAGHIANPATGGEESISHVVVFARRERRARPESRVEAEQFDECSTLERHVAGLEYV